MARLAIAVAVAVLALASGAASQAPAPAPSAGCSAAVGGLALCFPYVQPGSKEGKPSKECCAGVKRSVKSRAAVACLCAAFSTVPPGTVDVTRAAGLPGACGEDPAAFSKCNIKLPGGAPTQAPAPAPGSSPAASSPGKSAAARSPASAFAVVAAVAAPLLSYYYL